MIFVRDRRGVITFWNRAAEQAYGWSADEAVGQLADALLRTIYPDRREAIESALIDIGRWEGRVEQRTKAGGALTVDARWALQHDQSRQTRWSPRNPHRRHRPRRGTSRTGAERAAISPDVRREPNRRGRGGLDRMRTALNSLEPEAPRLPDYLARNPEFVRHARPLAKITDVNPALQKMVGAERSADFIDERRQTPGRERPHVSSAHWWPLRKESRSTKARPSSSASTDARFPCCSPSPFRPRPTAIATCSPSSSTSPNASRRRTRCSRRRPSWRMPRASPPSASSARPLPTR